MIGRQVIITNRAFTLEELFVFMGKYWDTEEYAPFQIGKPTPASVEEYILLPATPRFVIILYSRAAGGVFSKENKVILTVTPTVEGFTESMIRSIPSRSVISGIAKMGSLKSQEKERKGPAEEILQMYTAYMKELLANAGYIK